MNPTNKESVNPKTDSSSGSNGSLCAPSLEFQVEAYHAIAEWIRFADAKAAVVLTVGGALAGFLFPTLNVAIRNQEQASLWTTVCLVLFCCYVVFFVLSSIFAFLCINPLRKHGRHPSLGHCDLFHPAAISSKYTIDDCEKFLADMADAGEKEMSRQVEAAILVDSHISTAKYSRVTTSIRFFAISAAFGFAFYLLAQI